MENLILGHGGTIEDDLLRRIEQARKDYPEGDEFLEDALHEYRFTAKRLWVLSDRVRAALWDEDEDDNKNKSLWI